jgi:hypothetical protein
MKKSDMFYVKKNVGDSGVEMVIWRPQVVEIKLSLQGKMQQSHLHHFYKFSPSTSSSQ